jgi:hypothetical protein
MADVPLSLWVPELARPQLPASHSNSSQQLNCSSLTNSLTHQPAKSLQLLTCPAYNISAQTAQKTPLLCYSAIVAAET